jgi:arylformamidase
LDNSVTSAADDGAPWRRLDRASLDRAYNNAAAVADSAAQVAEWERASAELRARADCRLDLAYGPAPRQRIDYFSPGAGAPTLVFFHGGYWQSRAKDNFSFIARGLLAANVGVALVGYTLAPEADMDAIVAECNAAVDFVAYNARSWGAGDGLYLSGWSAGAHLAAMACGHPAVRGVLAISGVYDLEPIRHSYLNEKLGLDQEAALRNSPARIAPMGPAPMWVVAGEGELPELRRQSAEFAAGRSRAGLTTVHAEIGGANHFSILQGLALQGGALMPIVADMLSG